MRIYQFEDAYMLTVIQDVFVCVNQQYALLICTDYYSKCVRHH